MVVVGLSRLSRPRVLFVECGWVEQLGQMRFDGFWEEH